MIRYALVCAAEHRFEAWFRDSEAFDRQSDAGQLSCSICGSTEVRKAMMAPSIRRGSRPIEAIAPDAGPPAPAVPEPALPVAMPPPSPLAIDDERFRQMRALLRDLHAKVKESAENVGPAFAEEARRIHLGDAEARPIYGTADSAEVQALVDDGIEVLPLPPLPDSGH